MNYFEIINATLIELNYSTVNFFKDLNTSEHKRLMNIINRLNKEICNLNSKFHFRQMIYKMNLLSEKIEYDRHFKGKINKICGKDREYIFESDFTKFFTSNPPANSYGIYGEKLLFPKTEDNIRVFYSTDEFVKDEYGDLKSDFTEENDESIIPENFIEKIFINGAAFNFKQNTAHPKYIHWKKEFDNAVAQLQGEAKIISNSGIKINGGFRKL